MERLRRGKESEVAMHCAHIMRYALDSIPVESVDS